MSQLLEVKVPMLLRFFYLDSIALDELESYENMGRHTQSWARGILSYYGKTYLPDFLESENIQGRFKVSKPVLSEPKSGLLRIQPNPANSFVEFVLNNDSAKKEHKIIIRDVFGKTIEIIAIPTDESRLVWFTKELNSGIYFYQLTAENKSLQSGKILLNK